METWFWILGWVLSFLAIIGNGFIIFLVCNRRNLRTKTNAFIVSLAVADFCVGLSVIPFLFFCDITNTCLWPYDCLVFLGEYYKEVVWSLVCCKLMPLSTGSFYCHRLSSKIHYFDDSPSNYPSYFLSWVLTVCYKVINFTLFYVLYQSNSYPFTVWLTIFSEILPCVILILCFLSMIFHVCRHDQSARTLAKQLRFNHRVSFKSHHEKSAVIMMGLVIGVFLVCYGMYLRCSFLILFQTSTTITSSPCHDENYKIPVLVLNSAINPLAYAFFKRDIKKEFKRLVGAVF